MPFPQQLVTVWGAPAALVIAFVLTLVLAGALIVAVRRNARRAARALAESEALTRQLEVQATELRRRVEESESLRAELEIANIELVEATAEAHHARASAEGAVRRKDEVLAILDTVLDSSPVAFALCDRGLRFIRTNRAFTSITGAPPLEHIGASVEEVAPALAPVLVPQLARVLATDAPQRDVELSAGTTAAGDRGPRVQRHWIASFYPVRTIERGVLGVGVLMLEVSERKQLEEQFRQAQKMEAVGRLAGGIAHDFNNLLTVMTSSSELLLGDLAREDRRREDVEEIKRAAQRAAGLTRQLLAFSRKQILQPTLLDLNAVVGEMQKMLKRVLGSHITLETILDPELGFVRADQGQIEQVVMNLVVNARDAMPRGGRIVIETCNMPGQDDAPDAPPSVVVIEVRDEGQGIAGDALPHIFEPFYTTKEQGKGTGLGLSTVYGIVKQSGGDVQVESVPGKGSAFRILLPRYHDGVPVTRVSRVRRTPTRLTGTVLLVEDEESVRSLATRILRREGYTVLSASRGDEALELFARHGREIALLVSDVMLPGIDGFELAAQLRDARPSLKVLLMSGYADRDVGAGPGDIDDFAFVQKPFTPDNFSRRVGELLAAPAAAPQRDDPPGER